MANGGDEQRERQRQQRELEETRRNFAEMGARMGSLFEPTKRGAGAVAAAPAAMRRHRWPPRHPSASWHVPAGGGGRPR